jgi:alpha-glucosidase (family GH31 glycosyl hydrolase)
MANLLRPLALAALTGLTAAMAANPGAITAFKAMPARKEYTLATAGGIQVKITFYRPEVFRIQAAPAGAFRDTLNDPRLAQIVIRDDRDASPVQVTETGDQIAFATSGVTLAVARRDCRFSLRDAGGKVLWEEARPLEIGEKETSQTLASSPDEYFYGGGQQNGAFSHRGKKIAIVADGEWNEGGHPNPAPWFVSSRGYGVLRDTFSEGSYDFSAPGAAVLAHQERRFDALYVAGGSIPKCVDLYTQFTGRPNFVAIWSLEMGEADAWMARDPKTKELLKDAQGGFVKITPHVIPRLAELYRKNDFPGGWILPNDGYGCGYTDLPEVVKGLRALGFRTGLWTENALDKTKWEVGTAGTRVQKLDVAWTGPAYQFSLEANRSAWESLTSNSEGRGFVWTVQGWAGTQRYSVCWTGDQYGSWDLIRYHIPTLIGSGLSGQAYATTDVDGIFGGSPETYTRDLQWKCYTPVLYAMNGWSDVNKSPFSYAEPYRSINRDYLKLKMRLTPYMYKYAREAADTGAPIVRGLVWDFPGDARAWDATTQYQYLLGEWLLVAPVFTSMNVNHGWRREPITLPKGAWFDYWDGRVVEGPATLATYPVTLEKLPLFVRGGAILPMYPEMLYNDQKPKDPLTFDIYPWGESTFELYEDDGVTRRYQQGESARQRVTVKAPEGRSGDITITVGASEGAFEGKLATRVYEFQVHTPLKPASVELDGQKLLELANPGAFANCVSAWTYVPDEKRGLVRIRLPRLSTSKALTVRLAQDGGRAWPASEPYPAPVATPGLDKSLFTAKASSSHEGTGIQNAFDGTAETYWHSEYRGDGVALPVTVDIALNGLYAVDGFRYLPRQKGENGMIKDYEIYVGRSPENLGAPVAKGSFARSREFQTVAFPATWGEFVRLRILSEQNGKPFASAAEFDITRDLKAAPLSDQVSYLSALAPASTTGPFARDLGAAGAPLKVNGQTWAKGLGVKAGTELVYKLDGSWDRLCGHVGVDGGGAGKVVFRVFADGKAIFESPVMGAENVKQLMELNIKGVRELRLTLSAAGTGEPANGDWIDAKLVRKGSN